MDVFVTLVGAVVLVGPWGISLRGDIREWRSAAKATRQRARRELLMGIALVITAAATATSFLAFLLTRSDPTLSPLRQLLNGVAVGAFVAAGIVSATTRGRTKPDPDVQLPGVH